MPELFEIIKSENNQQRAKIASLRADVEKRHAAGEPMSGEVYEQIDQIVLRFCDLFFIATNINSL